MIPKQKALLSWSGGKDSVSALNEILQAGGTEVVALLTTLSRGGQRTCMHGVRRVLLEQQAEALDLRLEPVLVSALDRCDEYEEKMISVLGQYRREGVTAVIFGDIFLEDLRQYREERLSCAGMTALFPLWGRDTGELARSFIRRGFRAVVTCVDSRCLGESFLGQTFDETFLARLPETVDPCGENGEFHSFVVDGPLFTRAVAFHRTEEVFRENGFSYADLTPAWGGGRHDPA